MVKLIAASQVDWTGLMTAGKETTGRTLTSRVDDKGERIGDLNAYLTILDTFRMTVGPKRHLGVADHLSFSFLVCSTFAVGIELCSTGELHPLLSLQQGRVADSIFILSGTLNQWITFLERHSTHTSKEIQVIVTEIYLIFKQLGLRGVWSERGVYETARTDGTITFKKDGN